MSELMKAHGSRQEFRWQLLATVSALTLLAVVYGTSESEAADQDADNPTVWIELGGQLERLNNSQQAFSPPFMASITQANLLSALNVQQPSAYAIGSEGKISFQPDGSDWVFSASVQYGRSNAYRHRHQQTANAKIPVNVPVTGYPGKYFAKGTYYPAYHVKFADATAKQSETHGVVDFQAGKDVGLGIFGSQGSSVLSVGVRIAQFTSKTSVSLRAEPDVHYPSAPITSVYQLTAFKHAHVRFHDYAATASSQRSFRGAGPSVAWNASAPFAGESGRGEMSIDWGVNGAVLFGRQRASGRHKTTVQSYYETSWQGGRGGIFNRFINHAAQHSSLTPGATAHRSNAASFNRARTVVVPNLGGFAGISFRYASAKVSFGYRADFFFGAMDEGIDTRQTGNIGFNGPFATISIGFGG